MARATDRELLEAYAREGSEEAFDELVFPPGSHDQGRLGFHQEGQVEERQVTAQLPGRDSQ